MHDVGLLCLNRVDIAGGTSLPELRAERTKGTLNWRPSVAERGGRQYGGGGR